MKAIVMCIGLLAVMTSCNKKELRQYPFEGASIMIDANQAIVTTHFANGNCELFCGLTREEVRAAYQKELALNLHTVKARVVHQEVEADYVIRIDRIVINETVKTGVWNIEYAENLVVVEGVITQRACDQEFPFIKELSSNQSIEWVCDEHHTWVYLEDDNGHTKKEKQTTNTNCRYEMVGPMVYTKVLNYHTLGVTTDFERLVKTLSPCEAAVH